MYGLSFISSVDFVFRNFCVFFFFFLFDRLCTGISLGGHESIFRPSLLIGIIGDWQRCMLTRRAVVCAKLE